jgi:ribose/xylose/arabinose/galactoside ABC-type transport system permease subunit
MDAFSYLSVLISLILGLAITQVLKGFRGLMHARSRVRTYWPTVLWGALIIVIGVQSWWSMFGLRHHEDWTFLEFSAVLSQTIVLYLLAALVLPDIFGDDVVDLREHYYDHRRWFFALLVILIATSLLKALAIEHKLPETADLRFHIAFALTAVSGIVVAKARYHEFLAALGAVSILAYIAFLFEHLS